jgi:sugar O-acyltransferase (sialic acid O-acetyltransferase NeuD family)
MLIESVLIIGAGGHAKVVIDAITCTGFDGMLTIADDNPMLANKQWMGLTIIAPSESAMIRDNHFHVAVGNNSTRSNITARCLRAHMRPQTIIHPAAVVAASTSIGSGSFIAARAILAPAAALGNGCIVNHGAVIDHDCIVGEYCHIAPNATLGGGVTLGNCVLIGAGANILPNVTIGDNCVVGAGAVVVKDLVSRSTYAGVPATKINGTAK